jgi:hypothetical protein
MAGRQVAAHVPEFLQVEVAGALGRLDAERDVAALAALADGVLLLDRVGQGEEPLGRVDGRVDLRLVQIVVAEHREAVAAEAVAQGLRETGEIGVVGLERNRRDGGQGHGTSPLRIMGLLHPAVYTSGALLTTRH